MQNGSRMIVGVARLLMATQQALQRQPGGKRTIAIAVPFGHGILFGSIPTEHLQASATAPQVSLRCLRAGGGKGFMLP